MMNIKVSIGVLLAMLLLLGMACNEPEEEMEEMIVTPSVCEMLSTNSKEVHFLALGDSYTIGQDVDEEDRWPNQLSRKLVENTFSAESTEIIAQTGWTTRNLLDAIANKNIAPNSFNLVSLSIGVNNQYQQQSFETFKLEFNLLLEQSKEIACSDDRVFVVSIPDYGVTPFGSSNSEQIGQELDMYNAYMAETCGAQGVPFVDITEISRELGDSPGALASDNLHPSGDQYTAWVNEILPVVLEILE